MAKKLLVTLIILASYNIYSQTSLCQWRDHLPYTQGVKTAASEDKIYCLTVGGLFALNNNNNSLERLTKVTGLSGVSYSTITYSEYNKALLIGYSDGNIDMIKNNSIYNISDIKRKSIIGLKSINNILIKNEFAYLSCGFGIVVLNIEKQEILDTYYIGNDGGQLNINEIAMSSEYIYAATDKGVYRAALTSINLGDYNEWEKISFLPNPDETYNTITSFNSKVYVNYSNATGDDIIYEIDGNKWATLSTTGNISSLYGDDESLLVSNTDKVLFFNKTGNISRTIDNNLYWNPKPMYSQTYNDLIIIADDGQGMITFTKDNIKEFYQPNGPRFKDVYDIDIEDGKVWVAAGGPNDKYSNKGGYSFQNEKWINFYRYIDDKIKDANNFSFVEIDPVNTNHVYFSSYGYGLYEYLDNECVNHFDQTNSVLENVSGFSEGYINIAGMDFDSKNQLWICTTLSENPVYVKPNGEDIVKIEFEYDGFGREQRVDDILVTKNNNKWLLLEGKGIFVFDHDAAQGTYNERFFQVVDRDGQKLSNVVLSIAEDLKGNIWVGTQEGPVVYYNPENVFDENYSMTASQVLIPRNDGTDLADLLLETEVINVIAVDGADRKWMGTANAGVFLISKDGTKEIYHFNIDNSPLFSNTIIDIDINHETGEVFFATNKGIVSFKSNATKGNDDFSNVFTFPNPVREDYDGDITITGLVENVNVKITDISGNIVFETTALGGQAIWDGKNFDGKRVQTGVYMVFCTNDDGTKTHVTKILFIN